MSKKILMSLVCSAGILMAQQMPKENVVPIGNLNGSTGNVFSEGQLRLVLHNFTFEKDSAYDGSDIVNDPKKRDMKVNISKFVARYGLGNGFDVRVITPYIRKESSMTNPLNNQSFDNKNSGLGDITIVGRYQLLSQKAGDPMFLAVGAGVKLPTGDTDKYQTLPTGISKQPGM